MYNASSIQILKGIQHVRSRIRFHFGDHHVVNSMIWNVVGDTIDYCQNPTPSIINIILHDKSAVSISHNGQSYSANQYVNGQSAMELKMTESFERRYNSYVSATMGISGIAAVNGASRKLIIQTKFQGYLWQQIYGAGQPVSEVEKISRLESPAETGTTIWFEPDFTIVEQQQVELYDLLWQLQFLAGFIPETELTLHDQRSNAEFETLIYIQPCDQLGKSPIHEPLILNLPLDDTNSGEMDCEIQYFGTSQPCINAYFNGLPEMELRHDMIRILDSLRQYFNAFLNEHRYAPQDLLSVSDISAGLSLDLYVSASSLRKYFQLYHNRIYRIIPDFMDNLRMDDPVMFFRILEKCLDNRHYRVAQQ
jgi:DNA gyrase/topoisomerase IV subunit B